MATATGRVRAGCVSLAAVLDPKEVLILPFLALLAVSLPVEPNALTHPYVFVALTLSGTLVVLWCAGAAWRPVWHRGKSRSTRLARDLLALGACLAARSQSATA